MKTAELLSLVVFITAMSCMVPLALGEVTAITASALQCTAADVTVIGSGFVVNEPCSCTGTFDAIVNFTIENTASASRYCPTMYLCDPTVPSGSIQLVIHNLIPGKSRSTYSVTIPNYPCASGLRCYGEAPPAGLGQPWPKGATCPVGKCCDTVLWNTQSNDVCPTQTPIPSKCRHQQICIQGKTAAAACVNNCNPATCGFYTATIRLCGQYLSNPPYTFHVSDGVNPAYTRTSVNSCESFDVFVDGARTFASYIADSAGCRTNANDVSLTAIPAMSLSLGSYVASSCSTGTYTATATGGAPGSTYTYSFSVDNGPVTASTTGVFEYPTNIDGLCHQVSVSVTDGRTCNAGPKTKKITQCVSNEEC